MTSMKSNFYLISGSDFSLDAPKINVRSFWKCILRATISGMIGIDRRRLGSFRISGFSSYSSLRTEKSRSDTV